MVGQAAEQIIAGVVLSERLAVTMYGAIHRAQFAGQRNLRGLVVDPKILADSSFRIALTDADAIAAVTALDHRNIVPTVAVEAGGPDVVVVTRGVGRYVSVQDLIAAARANRSQGGKLPIPVAAAIGRSVIEALAAAHKARIVHGAVHPRSVLIDEDGGVRLGDFVVGRALTTAVALGADSALWRGLAGYLAPELVVGEEPTQGADVYAVGATLFTMLSGEAPPGILHVTPAVERLVQRSLDTDIARRYRSAADLLENLLEAFEDDRWDIADRGEVIKAAGLSRSDDNVDEATEDLLASLGSSPGAVQVTPIRPSLDLRAAAAAHYTPVPTGKRLDALLADLDGVGEHTAVDDRPFSRDPISEVIARDTRRSDATLPARPRVPSLDDPDDDDETPLPPPSRDSEPELVRRPRDSEPELVRRPRVSATDEAAAMNALADLHGIDDPARRLSTAAEQASQAADKLEQAANRAHAAVASTPVPARRAAAPLVDIPEIAEAPPVRLRSRAFSVIALLVIAGGGAAIFLKFQSDRREATAQAELRKAAREQHDRAQTAAVDALADPGTITVTATPSEASVWLKLGRTNVDSMALTSSQRHRLRLESDGYQPVDTEVVAASWEGTGPSKRARVAVTLKAVAIDKKTRLPAIERLPALPPNLADAGGYSPGSGPIRIETSPPGAEAWLLIGFANSGVHFPTTAGRAYELRVLADGYKPGYASITADEWRQPGTDPNVPLDLAKKKLVIEKHVTLEVDPDAAKPAGKPKGK